MGGVRERKKSISQVPRTVEACARVKKKKRLKGIMILSLGRDAQ